MQNGKGSKPRPIKDLKQYLDNFDSINWGEKNKKNKNSTCESKSDGVVSDQHETPNSPSTSAERETS